MEEETDSKKSPLWYIAALFLVFIMVFSIFPYYAVKHDPRPTYIPSIEEIMPGYSLSNITVMDNREGLESFVTPAEPLVKQAATRIATFGCDDSKLCQAKAEFLFVQRNFIYVSEQDEYVQSPQEMFATRGGDCDDHAVLLSNLLQAIGIPTRFVYVPRHVYVEAYLPDAPGKYQRDGWVALDATCKGCEFGKTTGFGS